MKSSRLKFLVTGGRGYIGSHMCHLLHHMGHEVVSLDNLITAPLLKTGHSPDTIPGKNLNFDIGDRTLLPQALAAELPIHGVFHFAARALVGESELNPWLYHQENVSKSLNFFQTLHELKIRKVIFSSTCATYGIPEDLIITELTPQLPMNSYGKSKWLLEQVVQDLVRHHFFEVYCLRYFNVAGCAADGSLGEHHDPETHVIPNLVKSLLPHLKNKSSAPAIFNILGDKYPTQDGTCIRDYIHVEDIAQGHWLAMEKLLQNNPVKGEGFWDSINLGTGKGTSVKELLSLTEQISGQKVPQKITDPRPGDPPRLVADISKAKKILNFHPKYNAKDCIQHTWNYWKNYVAK
ncbi:MAG: UDP-glucose 4-epimerase GalE [Bacteriovoracaceae bacterium]|nr:UDP-glucose 4-epimerase GalE [Bacteriovoracaceae bacterium]